jgi:hypothetical protein
MTATLDIGLPYCGDLTGLAMTLSGMAIERHIHGLNDLTFTVVDNSGTRSGEPLAKEHGAKYVYHPTPTGASPARRALFDGSMAKWQACLDDHCQFLHGDLARLVAWCRENETDDLYHGVMLKSRVSDGENLAVHWTHCETRWNPDGLFGVPSRNHVILKDDSRPWPIPMGWSWFFMARPETFLGVHPEARGFANEGYLDLKYRLAGRKVWCLPFVRTTHVFKAKGPKPNLWVDRARNNLLYWRDLPPNQWMTYAGVKASHNRPDRVNDARWIRIVAELGIDETAELQAAAAQKSAAPPAAPSTPTAWQSCRHRGEIIDRREPNLCGLPKAQLYPVHACALHGECVTSRTCKKQRERICYTCPDAAGDGAVAANPYDAELARGYPYFTYPSFCAELAVRCRSIVEVGSWKGFSSVAFAKGLKRRTDGGELHCVDVWDGKGALWGDFRTRFPNETGDHLFRCFQRNLERSNVSDIVTSHRMDSLQTAAQFAAAGRRFDAVFIDADHSYQAVRADILAWRPLIKPGGVLCGHDYDNASVRRAVDELLPGVDLRKGNVWLTTVNEPTQGA